MMWRAITARPSLEVDPPAAVLLTDTPDEVTQQATAPCGVEAADSEDSSCFAAKLATSLRLVWHLVPANSSICL
jgi:hypothetical protein